MILLLDCLFILLTVLGATVSVTALCWFCRWLLSDFHQWFEKFEPIRIGFDRRWPPIDEDEFIEQCQPGVDRSVALRVRRIVSEQLGIPYNQIYPEQNFVNDLGCD